MIRASLRSKMLPFYQPRRFSWKRPLLGPLASRGSGCIISLCYEGETTAVPFDKFRNELQALGPEFTCIGGKSQVIFVTGGLLEVD